MLLWPGICIVHQAFSETELLKLKAEHPDAPVAAHPECPPHIIDHADLVGSTKAILDFALSSPAETIIVATEPHIIHQMEKAAPHKTFIGAPGGDGPGTLEESGDAVGGEAAGLPGVGSEDLRRRVGDGEVVAEQVAGDGLQRRWVDDDAHAGSLDIGRPSETGRPRACGQR